ncbi:hypothetical protein AGOR_G00230160 [Albula goreensis]|uniref:Uncharacterized protein n=1 Tax=Albula goreensis TaxID=1534307 RepID=A0A8T3CI52_9TELE|nr:hypothetical protein AGOR_G00230160 [Albula goreensis]
MDRNYPGTGFGDLGAGTGWSYERSAKASLVYGSSRSSHPESELLHRQAYATPHPLQGYTTNHHPASSGQGGAWGAAGRSLGLSGLFDTSLHHASPSGPDASVMNLISALESRGPQPPPSASSLLSQFRTPSWQTAMHTPAPAELFISGALPGSGSFPSSSALSAYQHPASFSGRTFPGVTSSLSLQDTPTFSPTSNGLLSPHDPLLHIKTPSQSSLGFDRLLSSQGAAYRGGQDPGPAPPQSSSSSSSRHLPPPQFNLLSSQLQDQSSQLYNASVFSPTPGPPQQPPQERTIPRQDSVIKHYQRPSPSQSQLPSSATHSLQHYLSCGVTGYQQIAHHRHGGLSCSPLGDLSPSSDPKPSPRTDQVYRPIIQPPYTPSTSSSSSGGVGKGAKSSSSSGYSSSSSGTSSRTPHTPPSASSTTSNSSSSSSSSNANPTSNSSTAPSRQQPPPQSVPPPPPPPIPPVSSTPAQQPPPKACLSGYGSPVAPVKPASSLSGQTPPQQQSQSYSPSQPPPSHLPQPYGGFSSPQAQDLSSGGGVGPGKGYGNLGAGGRSFSAEVAYGADTGYGSLPASLGGAGSPSLGYGSGGGGGSGGGSSGSGAGGGAGGGGGGPGGGGTGSVGSGGGSSYHLQDSSPSPSGNSGIIRPGLHSPAAVRPAQSPGGAGGNKYLSSVLSPAFLSSPQGYPDTRGPPQSYHPTPPKPKSDSDMLGVERSQDDDDDDDFLIQHLLQAQSPAHHPSQHHPQQPQPPQPQDSSKGMPYELSKASEERYHLQSVIRTNNATASTGGPTGGSLDSQLEMSMKKQQSKNERGVVGGGASGDGRGTADQTHTHPHPHHHESLGSVVHYSRADPYAQHPLPHHPSHHQLPQHPHPHPHMELKKPQNPPDLPYLRKTPDLQPQQHQASLSLMDSPPDPAPQPAHLLQSVLSHTTRNKMDTPARQQHMSQQSMMGGAGGGAAGGAGEAQSRTSQLQMQLQSQALEAHYNRGHQQDQNQPSQNCVSPLDMLERSLSQTSSRDVGGGVERGGGGDRGSSDRHRHQQHRLSSHHQPHHPPHATSELHDFLSDSELGLSGPSHLHHLSPHQPHPHPHSHHRHPHSHLPHPHSQPHPHHMPASSGPPPQQAPLQQRDQDAPLSQPEMDPLKEHQYDPSSPVVKAGQAQQQRFVPLTSICFPDSLLQDEDRSFFPGMEDMFCSEDYKSSCSGGGGSAQTGQEGVPDGHQGQEGMEGVKNAGGGSYDMMGHHSDQGYGQYCQSLSDSGNGAIHLDLDSLKTHELPSTVNTEQLGLIQSQGPGMGMEGSGDGSDASRSRMLGGTGVGGSANTGGLSSPIFCSSRPKKLLKTSSFHLLKQPRDPNSLP